MKFHRRFRRGAAIALATFGLAVPAAQARLIDPPLGHDIGGMTIQQRSDLRSPDARDAARLSDEQQRQVVASRGQGAPRPVVTAAPPVTVKPADDGIDLGSVALGAGGFFAVVALFVAGNAAIVARRGRVHAVR